MRALLALLAALLLAAPAQAQDYAQESLPIAAQEEQALALMDAIRCVVCQGQPISGSDADLAGDMRRIIREKNRRRGKPGAGPCLAGQQIRRLGQLSATGQGRDPAAVAGALAGADRRHLVAQPSGENWADQDREEALMGWLLALGFAALAMLGLYLSKRLSRGALLLAAAALFLGVAGYAWQGSPGMAGNPVSRAGPR